MPCLKCGSDKLSNEFPPMTLIEDCDHPSVVCLRCTVTHVEEKKSCPYPGCGKKVDSVNGNVKWFKAILDQMFTEYVMEDTKDPVPCTITGSSILNVTVLNGESMQVPYNPNMTVHEIKSRIKKELKHDVSRQKLLYQEKELQIYKHVGEMSRLSEYDVKPNSTLYLVILLYAIPETFDHVIFDLYWGYPISGKDYLDASCLSFSGTSFINVVDCSKRLAFNGALHHSGDVMNDRACIGHHTINVKLKAIPSQVTHMFFTLSAWSSPNIARYPNPSLKFYEASNPTVDLCKTTFNHARNSQAVIMCSVSRNSSGCWDIFECGQLSAGNAKNYTPLQSTIQNLILQGF